MSGCPEQQSKKADDKVRSRTSSTTWPHFASVLFRFHHWRHVRGPRTAKPESPATNSIRELVRPLCSILLPICFVFTTGAMSGCPEHQNKKVQRQTEFENLFDNFGQLCFRAVSFSPLAPCPGASNSKTRKSSDELNSRTCSTTLPQFASALFRFGHWRHVRVLRTAKKESPATH